MKLAIGSGKGGVGKSVVAASLISILSKQYKLLCMDCDVDAPNLDLMIGVDNFDEIKEVQASAIAKVDYNECIGCGECYENCTFDVIEKREDGTPSIDELLCEGCGVCELVCQNDAIVIEDVSTGIVRRATTKYGPLISAQLYPGKAGSGKMVDEEKKLAEDYKDYDHLIADLPAGIGCPVMSSLNDMDYFLGIVEPTQASFENLKRMLNVVEHFRIKYSVIINKHDVNPKFSKKIEKEFKNSGVEILGKIPYDPIVPKAIVNLTPVVEYAPKSRVTKELKKIAKKIEDIL